jgi:hypothetical protein
LAVKARLRMTAVVEEIASNADGVNEKERWHPPSRGPKVGADLGHVLLGVCGRRLRKPSDAGLKGAVRVSSTGSRFTRPPRGCARLRRSRGAPALRPAPAGRPGPRRCCPRESGTSLGSRGSGCAHRPLGAGNGLRRRCLDVRAGREYKDVISPSQNPVYTAWGLSARRSL